ncbi:MAG TPA: PilZ domain-containing protein [Thermoanaerobaculia bacterium]|nr:PilZ domain-containing protein [Thermoanaerobaculia bacterium]
MSNYRRHYPRAADPSVILELPGDRGPLRAPIRDLSVGGARVRLSHTVPVGAELDVLLSPDVLLSDAATGQDGDLSLRARVLRIQRDDGVTDLSLEFVDRVERSSSRLQSWVESLRRGGSSAPRPNAETVELASITHQQPAAVAPPREPVPAVSSRGERAEGRRLEIQEELRAQVERADRAEASLQALRADLNDERERREAAERTLVGLQSELSRVRSERPELERLRREVEELRAPARESERDGLGRDAGGGVAEVGFVSDQRSPEREAAGCAAPAAAQDGERALLGPEEIRSRVVFARYLRDGAKLRRTDRFDRFEPVSRLDLRVHDFAKRASELAQIRKLAARRVSEEDLLRVLFIFFERGLLHLEPSGPADDFPLPSGSDAAS